MGATLRCGARASHCGGFSCCGARALGAQASVVVARGLSSCGSWALECRLSSLWCTGLVAPWHVGSSRTRARTRVPCIGRQILNHCTTREVAYVKLYLGQNEDCSPGDSISDSLEKLLLGGRGEGQYICDFGEGGVHCNQAHIFLQVSASHEEQLSP